jgi:hypothetical protein
VARQTTTQRILIALSSTLLLAGCTAADPGPSAPTESASASSSGSEQAGPRPVPSVVLTPAPVSAIPGGSTPLPSTGPCEIAYVDAAEAGTIGGVDIEFVRDRGTRTGATGAVTTAEDGTTPASYLVAAGDVSEQIADRFCISPDFLDALNSVRRDGVSIDSLFGGDTLNLSPATVLSVGDQNGGVLDNPEPDPLPEQAE